MTMALVVITIVLIGVMGAGLLVFVRTDLDAVVEVNQGQKALGVADAGVRAAQRQILTDSDPSEHYDGGLLADDLPWSYCYQQTGCTNIAPTPTGSPGMTLDIDSNVAKVTILETADSSAYKVVSEGTVGAAKRKVEAVFKSAGAVSTPRAFFTNGKLNLTGSANADGVSFFAESDVSFGGNFTFTNASDAYFGRWAETSGSGPYPNSVGSFPNPYNETPRGSAVAGIASLTTVTCQKDCGKGTGRTYDSTTTPSTVRTYPATTDSSKIAFPFHVPTAAEDKANIESLRQRALQLERDKQGQSLAERSHYIDSNPGNGVDDAGMPNRASRTTPLIINSWYSSSDFATVRFYEYETYNSNNYVQYGASPLPSCGSTAVPPRGVIVLQNGDLEQAGNVIFAGGMLVRAYDSAGNRLPPPSDINTYTNGSYVAAGSGCIKGYANSSGNMKVTGNVSPGGLPDLGGLSDFQGSMQTLSWRELYQ